MALAGQSPSFSRVSYKSVAFPERRRDHGRCHDCPGYHGRPAGVGDSSAVRLPLEADVQQQEIAPRPFPTAHCWECSSVGTQEYTKILHQGKRNIVDLGEENLGIRCNTYVFNSLSDKLFRIN